MNTGSPQGSSGAHEPREKIPGKIIHRNKNPRKKNPQSYS